MYLFKFFENISFILNFWPAKEYYKNESIDRNSWYHCHKKQKDSLKTHLVFVDIFTWTWNIWGSQTESTSKLQKNGGFCEELLSENYFEVVLVNFCCYDYGANASEAVQTIITRTLLELCQLINSWFYSYIYEKTYLAIYYLLIRDTSQVSVFFPGLNKKKCSLTCRSNVNH